MLELPDPENSAHLRRTRSIPRVGYTRLVITQDQGTASYH